MSHYQKVEYRIGRDGQVIETVLNGSGSDCTTSTIALEAALGSVVEQERLPEYFASSDPAEGVSQRIQAQVTL